MTLLSSGGHSEDLPRGSLPPGCPRCRRARPPQGHADVTRGGPGSAREARSVSDSLQFHSNVLCVGLSLTLLGMCCMCRICDGPWSPYVTAHPCRPTSPWDSSQRPSDPLVTTSTFTPQPPASSGSRRLTSLWHLPVHLLWLVLSFLTVPGRKLMRPSVLIASQCL